MFWHWNRRGEAGTLRIERRGDGQLWAVLGGEEREVRVRRLFPWSGDPHVSLRDLSNRELVVVGPEDELDQASSRALEEATTAASFVLELTRVLEVRDEIEIRTWEVETRQGARTFQTHKDEWPRDVPGGGFLIRDVAGDLYLVSDPSRLDARSRRLLWAFVD